MICKMFTINGKAPTIGNTALTGSAIADPGVVLEYFNTGTGTPHYDGFSVRVAKSGTTATIDYENMCYYSTAKYDNPDPSQLTKATFIPMSLLRYTKDPDYTFNCLASITWVPGLWPQPIRYPSFNYVFPCDEDDYDHAGAYVIPTAEYAGQSLYVYVWLPDVLQSPENKDQAGLDCTVLKTKAEEIGVNIHKCDMPGLNKFNFNQTYVKSAINCDFSTSAHQYFGFGDIIDNTALSPIELMSGCDIRQYLTGQTIDSAYDSKFYGFPSANYVENSDISGQFRMGNTVCDCYVQSALNSKLHNVYFKSANNCDIYVDGVLSGSAFNSKLTISEDYGNNSRCLINCTASGLIHTDNYLTAEDSYITSTYLDPGRVTMFGHYKNTYITYNTDPMFAGTYYAEDYPTKPFVKI